MSDPSLAEELRRAIFLALVEAQDYGVKVPESRRQVAARFGLSERQVLDIEREGMDNEWPPLG
jgi:hypothetical protein